MTSQLHVNICAVRTFGSDGALAPVFVEVSDVETIVIDGTNKTSTLNVTEAMAKQYGGESRLCWRLVLQGDVDARVARALVPVATGNRVNVMLAGSEMFVGVETVGEKIAVTSQSKPA